MSIKKLKETKKTFITHSSNAENLPINVNNVLILCYNTFDIQIC